MTMTETKTYKKTNTKTKIHRHRQRQSASKTQCMLYLSKAGDQGFKILYLRPYLRPLLSHYSLGTVVDALAFLLDPCSCPMVISAAQEMKNQAIFNECLYLCRVWCHGNHKLRLKLLRNRALIWFSLMMPENNHDYAFLVSGLYKADSICTSLTAPSRLWNAGAINLKGYSSCIYITLYMVNF